MGFLTYLSPKPEHGEIGAHRAGAAATSIILMMLCSFHLVNTWVIVIDYTHEEVGVLSGDDGKFSCVLLHSDLCTRASARNGIRSSEAYERAGSKCDIDDW